MLDAAAHTGQMIAAPIGARSSEIIPTTILRPLFKCSRRGTSQAARKLVVRKQRMQKTAQLIVRQIR